MSEKSPKKRSVETGRRTGMHENTTADEFLAGVSIRGLGEQMSARKRRGFEVQVQKIDPAIMETALDLAQNDPRLLQFNDDGSVTVKNSPSQTFSKH